MTEFEFAIIVAVVMVLWLLHFFYFGKDARRHRKNMRACEILLEVSKELQGDRNPAKISILRDELFPIETEIQQNTLRMIQPILEICVKEWTEKLMKQND